jgi:hypothetical protein
MRNSRSPSVPPLRSVVTFRAGHECDIPLRYPGPKVGFAMPRNCFHVPRICGSSTSLAVIRLLHSFHYNDKSV